MGALGAAFAAPFRDVLEGLERCLESGFESGSRQLIVIFLGLACGWWIYVPIHELMHAAACWTTGGTVGRLEIAPAYGGTILATFLPFVEAGGEYAGRLADFETGGSDWVYLATVLGPYLLTLFPGVWAMRNAGERGWAFAFGFWLPWALVPFLSIIGDGYEIGSIVTTWLPPWEGLEILRGDDLFRLVGELSELADPPWEGVAVALLISVLWAFTTYALGRLLPKWLERSSAS